VSTTVHKTSTGGCARLNCSRDWRTERLFFPENTPEPHVLYHIYLIVAPVEAEVRLLYELNPGPKVEERRPHVTRSKAIYHCACDDITY
jgi:hypothetical protein